MTFKNLKLVKPILKAIHEKGYESPTKIQEKAIPLILKRNDILGIAQTGTGKTAAFAIPIIQLIYKIDGINNNSSTLRALILTPTRELAIQIKENIDDYNKYTNLKHSVIFGGIKQYSQVKSIKNGIQILVATPGRLIDLINQQFISLDDIKLFVLDEADRMLDMGFINDIKKIIALLPKKRQNIFFSATMPDKILDLSKKILVQPKKVQIKRKSSVVNTIDHFVYFTNKKDKTLLLSIILKEKINDQVLIFVRTKHGADKLVRKLTKLNYKAAAIHGNKSQNNRQKTLNDFKNNSLNILVATDIAARGIDVNKLNFVINFDIPNLPETYVHRIGRSGRAGQKGVAYSICEPEENSYLKDIENLIKISIPIIQNNPYPQTDKPMTVEQKKEFTKEKIRKKREFFNSRKRREKNK